MWACSKGIRCTISDQGAKALVSFCGSNSTCIKLILFLKIRFLREYLLYVTPEQEAIFIVILFSNKLIQYLMFYGFLSLVVYAEGDD